MLFFIHILFECEENERKWDRDKKNKRAHTSTNILDWAANKIIKFIIHLYYQVVCLFVHFSFVSDWEIETGRYCFIIINAWWHISVFLSFLFLVVNVHKIACMHFFFICLFVMPFPILSATRLWNPDNPN